MARYHINPTTGNPSVCKAAAGNCPFKSDEGTEAPHYSSGAAARRAYEANHVVFQTGAPFPEAPQPQVQNKKKPEEKDDTAQAIWRKQGFDQLADHIERLEATTPGTPEALRTFQTFTEVYGKTSQEFAPQVAERLRVLEAAHDKFLRTAFAEGRAEASSADVSEAAYAYLDSYSANMASHDKHRAFSGIKERAISHIESGGASEKAAIRRFQEDEAVRWSATPHMIAWNQRALEAADLSSEKLLRFHHLGGGFVERYELALAQEQKMAELSARRERSPLGRLLGAFQR
jgi:hypothetical protein